MNTSKQNGIATAHSSLYGIEVFVSVSQCANPGRNIELLAQMQCLRELQQLKAQLDADAFNQTILLSPGDLFNQWRGVS